MTTRSPIENIEHLDRSDLIDLLYQQQSVISELQSLIKELQDQNDQLRRLLADSNRFTRGSGGTRPKKEKKPPGRKPGKGPFLRREGPSPSSITSHQEVKREDRRCPQCRGELHSDGYERVSITELPKPVKPEVLVYDLERCRCSDCGHRVRAEHPDVAENQRGATAHRLGPRLKATAGYLHYHLGLPQRKVPELLDQLYGLKVTTSALTQSFQRYSERRLAALYQELGRDLAASAILHTDDTTSPVGGEQAWLMSFSSPETCYYQTRDHHRHQEVLEVIGPSYGGVLITDRFSSYNHWRLQDVRQQKCLAHIQRNLSDHIKSQPLRAREFPRWLKETFAESLHLHQRFREGELDGSEYQTEAAALLERLDRLLAPRSMLNQPNQSMLDSLSWHHQRGSLTRFLQDPIVPPTNNEAERMLRPAVIARKVSHGSASWRGAETRSIFLSITQTLRRRGVGNLLESLLELFEGKPMPAACNPAL